MFSRIATLLILILKTSENIKSIRFGKCRVKVISDSKDEIGNIMIDNKKVSDNKIEIKKIIKKSLNLKN